MTLEKGVEWMPGHLQTIERSTLLRKAAFQVHMWHLYLLYIYIYESIDRVFRDLMVFAFCSLQNIGWHAMQDHEIVAEKPYAAQWHLVRKIFGVGCYIRLALENILQFCCALEE